MPLPTSGAATAAAQPLATYACTSLPDDAFARETLAGLARPQKEIPCAWLYDQRGSELFEEITQLDEYYQTRTEIQLLEQYAPEIAACIGPGALLVELGSGSSRKTPLLLRALEAPRAYIPVDIAAEFLHASASQLAGQFDGLPVFPVVADFSRPFRLPPQLRDTPGLRAGFFPGSTLGNFNPAEAVRFLQHMGRILGPARAMIIGVDANQNVTSLIPAYNDRRGVTAQFNLNLLARINRELGADFVLDNFYHEARYHAALNRIEMHLVSRCAQEVHLLDKRFSFADGETIHTENSYKYSVPQFQALARSAGWAAVRTWTDPAGRFGIHLLRPLGK